MKKMVRMSALWDGVVTYAEQPHLFQLETVTVKGGQNTPSFTGAPPARLFQYSHQTRRLSLPINTLSECS